MLAPRGSGVRRARVSLGDVAHAEIVASGGLAEINDKIFAERRAVLTLRDGRRVELPLPMSDDESDRFVVELRARVAAAAPDGDTRGSYRGGTP